MCGLLDPSSLVYQQEIEFFRDSQYEARVLGKVHTPLLAEFMHRYYHHGFCLGLGGSPSTLVWLFLIKSGSLLQISVSCVQS